MVATWAAWEAWAAADWAAAAVVAVAAAWAAAWAWAAACWAIWVARFPLTSARVASDWSATVSAPCRAVLTWASWAVSACCSPSSLVWVAVSCLWPAATLATAAATVEEPSCW